MAQSIYTGIYAFQTDLMHTKNRKLSRVSEKNPQTIKSQGPPMNMKNVHQNLLGQIISSFCLEIYHILLIFMGHLQNTFFI